MKFANRMNRMGDKTLLSTMELTDAEDVISFGGGFPSPETYPLKEIKESFYRVLEEDAGGALSYSSTRGYPKLRRLIAERMRKNYGLDYCEDEIIITNGSQQALDLSGLLLIDKDDVVLFETPSYLGALNALKAYEARLCEVPTDDDGIQIDALVETLEKYGERVKLIYVIPDFQNPTGRCWSQERRKAFMEVVGRYDVAVLEDAAYSELSFHEELEKPLLSYDEKGQVVYCGTFSKVFCPGLRIGWVCAKRNLIEPFLLLKNNVDLSSAAITQRQMADYLTHNDLDQHIRRIVTLYKKRRDVMKAALRKEMPEGVTFHEPQGGLFFWLTLPEGRDSEILLARALAEKVAFVPGGAFYPHKARNNEMRVNFSNVSEAEIEEGIARLGRVIRTYLSEPVKTTEEFR